MSFSIILFISKKHNYNDCLAQSVYLKIKMSKEDEYNYNKAEDWNNNCCSLIIIVGVILYY